MLKTNLSNRWFHHRSLLNIGSHFLLGLLTSFPVLRFWVLRLAALAADAVLYAQLHSRFPFDSMALSIAHEKRGEILS